MIHVVKAYENCILLRHVQIMHACFVESTVVDSVEVDTKYVVFKHIGILWFDIRYGNVTNVKQGQYK